MGPECFSGCSNLTEVIVPEGMKEPEWYKQAFIVDGNSFEGTHLNLKSQAALKAIGYTGNF